VSQATLNAFEGSDPPVRYIVGVRMRRQKEVRHLYLGAAELGSRAFSERIKAKDLAPLKIKARLPGRPHDISYPRNVVGVTLFSHVSSKTYKRIQLTVHEQVARHLL